MSNSPEFTSAPEQNFNATQAREKFIQEIKPPEKEKESFEQKETVERGLPILRELDESEKQKYADLVNDENQMDLTRELMKWGGLRPVIEVEVEGRKFALSKLLKAESSGRDQIMMYYTSEKTGKVYPRALYKSKSDGGWRSCPGSDGDGHYSKGLGVHYTQETKPHEDIVKAIEQVEASLPVIEREGLDVIEYYFDYTADPGNKPEWLTYTRETRKYDDQGALAQFQKFPPGYYTFDRYQGTDFSSEFRNFDFNQPQLVGFLPDFDQAPERTLETTHTLLGPIKTETYPAVLQGRPIEWVMAYDPAGRVWIDRIAFTDAWINSYGVRSEIIDSGALTNKPLEYGIQIGALNHGTEFTKFESDSSYCDITPLLDNLRPIKEFRSARGINRETNQTENAQTIGSAKSSAELK